MIVALCLASLLATAPDGDYELLQFSSAGCKACRMLEPVVDRVAADGVSVRHIDFEAHEDLARQYRIERLPTLVLIHNGQEVDRTIGYMTYDRLTGWLTQAGVAPYVRTTEMPDAQALSSPLPTQPQRQDLFASVNNSLTPTSNRQANAPLAVGFEPQRAASPGNLSPDQLAMSATVRLKVDDGQGFGFGTGTIVDVHGTEALIFTCAHLFRESQGKGQITIDMFQAGQPQNVPGRLIDYDLHRDVALVAFRPGVQVAPVPVAGPDYRPQVGEPVFTIGCNKGNTPTIVGSQLASIDKFHGRPNVTVKGQPIDGRSGGGLFTADGRLVGICNAADAVDDEGLYASLPAIHWQLDRIGQQRLYRNVETSVAATPSAPIVPVAPQLSAPANIPALPATMPRPDFAQTASHSTPDTSIVPLETATHQPAHHDLEVLCVVRSKTQPHLPPQVFSLQQLPPEVQQQISARNEPNPAPQMATNPGQVIIRGQR